jgi:hypothetical protein
MRKMTAIFFGVALLSWPWTFAQAAQKTMKLTTYYPAPYGDYIKLSANQIHFNPLAADPAAADSEAGDLYYQSTSKQFRYHDGTSWGNFGGGGLVNSTASHFASTDLSWSSGNCALTPTPPSFTTTGSVTIIASAKMRIHDFTGSRAMWLHLSIDGEDWQNFSYRPASGGAGDTAGINVCAVKRLSPGTHTISVWARSENGGTLDYLVLDYELIR